MEKRNFSRIPFKIEAQFEYNGQTIRGEVENLSMKGMLLKTDIQPEIHTMLPITIVLSEGYDESLVLHINGTVVRQTPEGIGIYFDEMDLDSFSHLSKIIEYNSGDPEKVKNELIDYIRKNLTEEEK
ncbi:MAG TPA: PilZ domain-containing protein [Bacillota bacterium]|nr:PilZ domain-containing protein [Bacillota bacterium]HPT88335.1 PilZ domain-containing protein [Bacillota bacterium]